MRSWCLLFVFLAPSAGTAGVVIDARCVIQHEADAAETTQWAARELQRLVFAATGEKLALVSGKTAAQPAIRLVEDAVLPQDGFVIREEAGDLIIAGNESSPQGIWAVPSHGTLWGVCEFAERFLGVRWLFPGPLGEDIPPQQTLRVELPAPLRGQPGFAVRAVAYVGESDREIVSRHLPVLDWMKHQRLTNALHPFVTGYGHSWDDYLHPADFEEHPEWKPASGNYQRNGKVTFFCTTAPGVAELFAKRVIESLDRNPKREMASISPTDGGGFCTCERCRLLLENDPHGKPNHARALLTFYQQVGEIIARERPGRRLGGFVYYNYQYPPAQPPRLPENVSLCWAPLNYYGYGLLKPAYRAEFPTFMRRWSEVTPRLFYHNYSTWMRSFHGAPLPVSLDILQRELPVAAQSKVWGARMVGTSAWGVNAPLNYLLARQLWNPQLDVSAALQEWLQRAYGPGWGEMRSLYAELDEKMAAHKAAQSPVYKGANYEVNEEVLRTIYAPLFPAMERHYRAALAECATEPQRQRLEMFGDNLTQLHFALRKAGLIASDAPSIFHRDDADYAKFLQRMESTFSLYRDARGLDHGPIWKGEWQAP